MPQSGKVSHLKRSEDQEFSDPHQGLHIVFSRCEYWQDQYGCLYYVRTDVRNIAGDQLQIALPLEAGLQSSKL
jgi:hypothetical protein